MSQSVKTPETGPDVDPYTVPLDKIDPARSDLFDTQAHWKYFERLRKEDPVHYCADSEFGPYWSITKFKDIVYVDSHHEEFSSEPTIVIGDAADPQDEFPMFIAMDQPKHDAQRKAVTPSVAPMNLAKLEGDIRTRVCKILDDLPVGETFNWVDRVSIETTTQMLASLFNVPWEDRYKLTHWSDVSTSGPTVGSQDFTEEERRKELMECLEYFTAMWHDRLENPIENDMITLMAHNPDMQNMTPEEFLGNLMLLIVGGNDTTRNSSTAGVLALNENPVEYDKLRADPGLIPNMVSEIIRWQTPLGHMRRNALKDVELNGKLIKKGDKVVMWYISGNRDEDVIERANEFLIDRAKARHHVSFGFGIHRCMGNRLGEMQLRILWEEVMKRFKMVEVVGEPVRVRSNFVMGYTDLPVKLHRL